MTSRFASKWITAAMSIIMMASFGTVALASESSNDLTQPSSASTTSTTIYDNAVTFSNGYWGDSITIPSTGSYKIYYNVKSVTSTSDPYTFSVNGSQKGSGSADGSSHVLSATTYKAGATVSVGVTGTYGHTYVVSVMVVKY